MDTLEEKIAVVTEMLPLTEENVERFLAEIERITAAGDRRVVKPVLLLADDNCALGGVMNQMLALLEVVPVEPYVEELLDVLPEFARKSPRCAEDEVKKLLWSDVESTILATKARRLGIVNKAALRAILKGIGAPDLISAVKDVEAAL